MSAADTLARATEAGVELAADIRFKATKGSFPEALRLSLSEHKPEILRILVLGEGHGAGPPRPLRRSDLKTVGTICAESTASLWAPGRLADGPGGCLWVGGEAVPDAAEKLLSMLAPHWPAPIVSTLRSRWLARLKAMAPEAAFRSLYADALDVTTPTKSAAWPTDPRRL